MRLDVVTLAYACLLFSSYCTANSTCTWKKIKNGLRSNFYQHSSRCCRIGNTIKENKRTERNVYAMIEDQWPFITLNIKHGGRQVPKHYLGEIWQLLATRLHLNTFYIKVPENIREVKLDDADLSLLPSAMKSDVYNNYDYSQVVAQVWFDSYRRSKGHIDISPLLWSREVIIITTCITVVVTFFQWFLIRSRIYFGLDVKYFKKKENFYAIKRKPKEDIIYESTLIITCLNVLGLILQQGTQIKQNCSSARIVNICCTLLGLLMNTAYSALLIYKITSLENNVKFQPLNQIPRDWPHSLCMPKNNIAYEVVEKYSAFSTKQQWHAFLNQPPCSRLKMHHVPAEDYCKTGTVVIEMRYNVVQLQDSRSIKCEIVNDKTKYFPIYLALIFRKGFIHKESINQYLIKFYESGIMNKIRKKYLNKPILVDESMILREDYSVSISHVYILHKYFLLAILVSLCIFNLELIYCYTSNNLIKYKTVKYTNRQLSSSRKF